MYRKKAVGQTEKRERSAKKYAWPKNDGEGAGTALGKYPFPGTLCRAEMRPSEEHAIQKYDAANKTVHEMLVTLIEGQWKTQRIVNMAHTSLIKLRYIRSALSKQTKAIEV